MYKLKQLPEDFKVVEILHLDLADSGEYSYYKLTKKNYNTLDAVRAIARKLNIKDKFLGYAGNKDRAAITEQFVSIKNGPKKNLILKDLSLEYVGKGNKPISLGDNEGNDFEIVVRNLSHKLTKRKNNCSRF